MVRATSFSRNHAEYCISGSPRCWWMVVIFLPNGILGGLSKFTGALEKI